MKMKVMIVVAGIVSASLLAVAQDPTGITPAKTNQVHQPVVLPGTSHPQPLGATNQTSQGSTTNSPPSVAKPTTSSHITIIKGTDASTAGNGTLADGRHLPPNGDGVQVVTNSAGTPDDWRSGGSKPHVVPPRPSSVNP